MEAAEAAALEYVLGIFSVPTGEHDVTDDEQANQPCAHVVAKPADESNRGCGERNDSGDGGNDPLPWGRLVECLDFASSALKSCDSRPPAPPIVEALDIHWSAHKDNNAPIYSPQVRCHLHGLLLFYQTIRNDEANNGALKKPKQASRQARARPKECSMSPLSAEARATRSVLGKPKRRRVRSSHKVLRYFGFYASKLLYDS